MLKMLYKRSAHLRVCTVQLLIRNVSMEIWLLCEKASVTIDTQIKQYGNFVKHGGATSQLRN